MISKELELAFATMIIKARGHKYEDVKKDLKKYYNEHNFPFPFEPLERMFDYYWANTIEVVDKESLK